MSKTNGELVKEIEDHFTKNVSGDAKFTILTIKNLIESNGRVEESINELHTSITRSNVENEKLQKRLFYLTIVGIFLALVQVIAVLLQFLR